MHTAPYFTALGLLAIVNSWRVVSLRRSLKVSLGNGGNDELERAIRIFGNFSEYVPLGLVLLAVLEFVQAPVWYMHMCGASLLIGRMMHVMGLIKTGSMPARSAGMILTWLSIILSSIGVSVFSLLQLRG